MSNKFEQISLKPGFMKHNGGVMFRNISDSEYEFKSSINENHLNAAGITHGGYLSAIIGNVKILKKTKTLVFLFCELKTNNKIITSASGIWKILKIKPSD